MTTVVNQKVFALKGSLFTLSVIQLLNSSIEQFGEQLAELIQQAPKFFENAPIVLDLQFLPVKAGNIDFHGLNQHLHHHGLIPVGVRGGTAKQHAAATAAGMAILSGLKAETPELQNTTKSPQQNTEQAAPKAVNKLITKPVRSGQQIYARGGDLIISATVSEGAELIADGNIHVYGALRGRALAGVTGNEQARIFCQTLEAELVAIAGHFVVNDAISADLKGSAAQIFLEDSKLQITRL